MAKGKEKTKQKGDKAQKQPKSGPQLAVALRSKEPRAKLDVKKGQSRKQARKARHPDYQECTVTCACGNTFHTRSVLQRIEIDVCSSCHPFYSGEQRYLDRAGRVEKFQRKYNWKDGKSQTEELKKKKKKKLLADLQD